MNNNRIRRERHIYCSELVDKVKEYGVEGFLETQGVHLNQIYREREK